jgi:hypothetical protein
MMTAPDMDGGEEADLKATLEDQKQPYHRSLKDFLFGTFSYKWLCTVCGGLWSSGFHNNKSETVGWGWLPGTRSIPCFV